MTRGVFEFSVHARALGIEGATLFDISTGANVNRYGARLECASRVRLKRASIVKTLTILQSALRLVLAIFTVTSFRRH